MYTDFMEKNVLNYRIIIEKEKYEDGSIVSDYGDAVEDVLESIKEGIQLAVESLAKEGKDVPVDHIEEQFITSTKIIIPSGIKISLA